MSRLRTRVDRLEKKQPPVMDDSYLHLSDVDRDGKSRYTEEMLRQQERCEQERERWLAWRASISDQEYRKWLEQELAELNAKPSDGLPAMYHSAFHLAAREGRRQWVESELAALSAEQAEPSGLPEAPEQPPAEVLSMPQIGLKELPDDEEDFDDD